MKKVVGRPYCYFPRPVGHEEVGWGFWHPGNRCKFFGWKNYVFVIMSPRNGIVAEDEGGIRVASGVLSS